MIKLIIWINLDQKSPLDRDFTNLGPDEGLPKTSQRKKQKKAEGDGCLNLWRAFSAPYPFPWDFSIL